MTYYCGILFLSSTLLAGILGIIGSRSLDFFEGSLPGAGFFPMVFSIILVILALLEIKSHISAEAEKNVDGKKTRRLVLFLTSFVGGLLVGVPLLGLLPALGLFYFSALVLWFEYSYSKALVNASLFMLSVYGIFSIWLGVSMPWGILGGM